MYKVVFCDLDGTLFDRSNVICEQDKENIGRLKEKGCLFVPCTGRHPGAMKMLEEAFGFAFHDYVCTNGAVTVADDEYVFFKALSRDVIDLTIKEALAHRVEICIFHPHGSKVYRYGNVVSNAHQSRNDIFATEEEMYAYANDEKTVINKFMLVGDHEQLRDVRQRLTDALGERAVYSFSYPELFEVVPAGVDKGMALRTFLAAKQIELSECLGIGDSENDIQMLKTVGLATCPANSDDNIKEMADYVSPKACNEAAVSDIIRRYILEV